MIHCPNCGRYNEDGNQFCTGCGTRFDPFVISQKVATKKDFLKLPVNKKMRSELISDAVICYIAAALSLLIWLFLAKDPLLLVSALLLLGLGLGIHLTQSKVCAVILCTYAVVNTIYGLAQNGKFSGYLLLIAGIYSVITTFKVDKAWNEYQQMIG